MSVEMCGSHPPIHLPPSLPPPTLLQAHQELSFGGSWVNWWEIFDSPPFYFPFSKKSNNHAFIVDHPIADTDIICLVTFPTSKEQMNIRAKMLLIVHWII